MIPILFLLILVVGGIRVFPWLSSKLKTGTHNFPPQSQNTATSNINSSSTANIEVDTQLAPIITDRSVTLSEARSQQLTEFLSDLNDAPEITVSENSNDVILQNEIKLATEPNQVVTPKPKVIIKASPTVVAESPRNDQSTPQSTEQPRPSSMLQTTTTNSMEKANDDSQVIVSSQVTETNDTELTENSTLNTTTDSAVLAPIPSSIENPVATAQDTQNSPEPTQNTQAEIGLGSAEATVSDSQMTSLTDNAQKSTGTEVALVNSDNSSPEDMAQRQISASIHNWASAWSRQALEQYFQSYTPDMTAPKYQTHEKWRAWRSARLTKPKNISVGIDEVEITLDKEDKTRATASFVQNYHADTYSDKVTKILELVNVDDRWLISREKSFSIAE